MKLLHSNKSKSFKALSLLEVIIVLAIISVTMVSSMTIIARANSILKDNEIEDTANDILLQSYELLRSSEPIKVLEGSFTQLSQSGVPTEYTLEFENILSRNGYIKKTNASTAECTTSSVFNVESIGGSNRPYPICLRVTITPVAGSGGQIIKYNITLTLFYNLTGRQIREDYTLSRYEKFVEVK